MLSKKLLAASAFSLAVAAAAPAQAAFITGGISFSNGFESYGTTTSIVSDLVNIDIMNPVQALSCSGSFGSPCDPSFGGFARDFALLDNFQIVYDWNGFTFAITDLVSVTREALTCDAQGRCSDRLLFRALGSVSGNGFDETGILLDWTAQGSCVMDQVFAGQCASNVTASWSGSIAATGRSPIVIPEPHGTALLGLGALLAALVNRRRRR